MFTTCISLHKIKKTEIIGRCFYEKTYITIYAVNYIKSSYNKREEDVLFTKHTINLSEISKLKKRFDLSVTNRIESNLNYI